MVQSYKVRPGFNGFLGRFGWGFFLVQSRGGGLSLTSRVFFIVQRKLYFVSSQRKNASSFKSLYFPIHLEYMYLWRKMLCNCSPCLICVYLALRVANVCSIWDHMIMENFLKLNSLLLMKLLLFHCQLLSPCLVHTLFSSLPLSMGMFSVTFYGIISHGWNEIDHDDFVL